jgi:hypothetical protein
MNDPLGLGFQRRRTMLEDPASRDSAIARAMQQVSSRRNIMTGLPGMLLPSEIPGTGYLDSQSSSAEPMGQTNVTFGQDAGSQNEPMSDPKTRSPIAPMTQFFGAGVGGGGGGGGGDSAPPGAFGPNSNSSVGSNVSSQSIGSALVSLGSNPVAQVAMPVAAWGAKGLGETMMNPDPNSYTFGLLGNLMGKQAPAPVVDGSPVSVNSGVGSLDGVTSAGFASPSSIGVSDASTFGAVSTGIGVGDTSSVANTGMATVGNQSVSNDATVAAQDAANFGDTSASGGGGGSSKIICTAMNQAYGFGSFRNAIWIAYADKHLSKAHEVGYHTLFLPLVDFAFKRGDGKLNRLVRRILEWGTRHRSADLRAELRGTRRDTTGRIIRLIFEPLCYAVGKLKGH